MAVIKCEHGHYYNTDQYEECPTCWQMDFGYEEEEMNMADVGLLAVAFHQSEKKEEKDV